MVARLELFKTNTMEKPNNKQVENDFNQATLMYGNIPGVVMNEIKSLEAYGSVETDFMAWVYRMQYKHGEA